MPVQIDPSLFSLMGNQPHPADRYSLTGPAPSGYDRMRQNVSLDYGTPPDLASDPQLPPEEAMAGRNGMAYYAALAQLGAAVAQVISTQRQRPQQGAPMTIGSDAPQQPQPIQFSGTDYQQFLPQG